MDKIRITDTYSNGGGVTPSGSQRKNGVTHYKTMGYAFKLKKKNPIFLSLFTITCCYFRKYIYPHAPPMFYPSGSEMCLTGMYKTISYA